MSSVKNWNEQNARGVALHQQGWYLEAAKLVQEALRSAESELGPDHPMVAECLNNLAVIYHSQGKDAEAALFQQAVAAREGKPLRAGRTEASQPRNKLGLLNFAKHKYALAESIFNQALEIKKKALGKRHPDVLLILGNLADVYYSQGEHAEAESLLMSIRLQSDERKSKDFTGLCFFRDSMRCSASFPAELAKAGLSSSIGGVTENLSDSGVFIKTENWNAFNINEQVSVSLFLPSYFSDQDANIRMEGTGIINRIDEENGGVALRFTESFRRFKKSAEAELPERIRYRKIAHYLSAHEKMTSQQFLETYPNGFLVERSQMNLDKNVIFQLDTGRVDDENVLNELYKGAVEMDVLVARVIEIRKGKIDKNHAVITIGRSANNDLVLYNKMVSKSHARLHITSIDEAPYLVDVGSANCTFLNAKMLKSHEMYQLADGDEISFGPQTTLVFLSAKVFYDSLSTLIRCYA
jgi:tetratricopeptide (TPR) repeat protein